MTSFLRYRICCCLAAAACAAPSPAFAQARPADAPPGGSGLALDEVLRITMRDNPSIRVSARDAESQRGALVAAGDPFDARVQTSFANNRFNLLQPDATGRAYSFLETNQTQYSVGLQKQLRRGITLTPEIDVSRTALPALGVAATSQATAKLNVLVPLLRDRGAAATAAPERAAHRAFEASNFTTVHVTAQALLAATTAYWDYEAALARLAVLTDSEARARRLFDDTQRLVEAGERPRSDLTQVKGNLAAKRVTRVAAEQSVVDTRVRLGLVMGIGPTETAALGRASTPFPKLDAATSPVEATPVLVDEALRSRPDLRATEKSVESARLLVGAARENLKPRVDLQTSVGYAGLQVGGGSLASLVVPMYRNVPGPDFAVSLHYERPTATVGAHGRLLQAQSAFDEQQIAQQELERQIRTGVYQATESLARNAAGTSEAHEAVALFEETVRSEERKFQLGSSTLFDTIQAADALTNVRLSEIAAEREYAVALATLRFETGSLVGADPRGATVDVQRLLSLR